MIQTENPTSTVNFGQEERRKTEIAQSVIAVFGLAQEGQISLEEAADILAAQILETEKLADHDPSLTELLNARAFNSRLDRLIDTGKRLGTSISVMEIDLDYFKNLNDALGHDAGDEFLEAISESITTQSRMSDIAGRSDSTEELPEEPDPVTGRLGGDEFWVGLFNSTPKNALKVAQRISDKFQQLVEEKFQELGEQAQNLKKPTCSIGISGRKYDKVDYSEDKRVKIITEEVIRERETERKKLKKEADIALYEAKQERNKVCVYNQEQ